MADISIKFQSYLLSHQVNIILIQQYTMKEILQVLIDQNIIVGKKPSDLKVLNDLDQDIQEGIRIKDLSQHNRGQILLKIVQTNETKYKLSVDVQIVFNIQPIFRYALKSQSSQTLESVLQKAFQEYKSPLNNLIYTIKINNKILDIEALKLPIVSFYEFDQQIFQIYIQHRLINVIIIHNNTKITKRTVAKKRFIEVFEKESQMYYFKLLSQNRLMQKIQYQKYFFELAQENFIIQFIERIITTTAKIQSKEIQNKYDRRQIIHQIFKRQLIDYNVRIKSSNQQIDINLQIGEYASQNRVQLLFEAKPKKVIKKLISKKKVTKLKKKQPIIESLNQSPEIKQEINKQNSLQIKQQVKKQQEIEVKIENVPALETVTQTLENKIVFKVVYKPPQIAASQSQDQFFNELRPEIVSQRASQKFQKQTMLEQDIEHLPQRLNSLVEYYTPQNYIPVLVDSLARSLDKIDRSQSIRVEKQLKIRRSLQDQLNEHPLIVLGQSLKKLKKRISYTQRPNAASYYSFLHLTTKFGENFKWGKCKLTNSSISFSEISKSETLLNEFTQKVKSGISQRSTNPTESVMISAINEDLSVDYYTTIQNSLQSTSGQISSIGSFTLAQYDIFQHLALDPSYLIQDLKRDYTDPTCIKQIHNRGGYPYFQPIGWTRYGVNIERFNIQDKNNDWLSKDNNINQWAVMYHGLKNEKFANKIIKEEFKVGPNQVHKNVAPSLSKWTQKILQSKEITKEEYLNEEQYTVTDDSQNKIKYSKAKIGVGIYGSPFIHVCKDYCNAFSVDISTNVLYKIAFQCRVKPEAVYISSADRHYWLVREAKHIRPYGILISQSHILNREAYRKQEEQYELYYKQGFQKQNQCLVC